MPELTDLDAVWADLEARADAHPLPDLVRLAGRQSRRPRILLAAAAAAVVAGVAVGAAVYAGHSGGTPSAAGPPSTAVSTHPTAVPSSSSVAQRHDAGWTTLPTGHYLFSFDRLPGTTITSVIGVGTAATDIGNDSTYQEVQIRTPEGGFVLKVNTIGSWSPDGGTPLTVEGRAASYGLFLLHPEIPGHPVHPRTALAWQYAPDAWATVASTSDTPIDLAEAQRLVGLVDVQVGDVIPDPPPQGP